MSRVNVPIMVRSAVAAFPASYSKRAHTFRAAGGNGPASRARLGSESFIGLNKRSSVPAGLIAEHRSEHRPTCIRDGLRHPRLFQAGHIHIADNDQGVFARNPGTRFVQLIATRVRDLGMDGLNPTPIPGPLGGRQSVLIFPIVLERRNSFAVAARRQRLEAKVYSDAPVSSRQSFLDLALECDVPTPARILDKRSRLDRAAKIARLPETEFLAVPCDDAVSGFDEAASEWNPSQRSLGTPACPELWSAANTESRSCKNPANLAHRFGANTQFCARAAAQSCQVEVAWPFPVAASLPLAFGLALSFAAKVPDKIDGARVCLKALPARRIFDAKFIGQNHAEIVA